MPTFTPFEQEQVIQCARACASAFKRLVGDAGGIRTVKADIEQILTGSDPKSAWKELEQLWGRIEAYDEEVSKRCGAVIDTIQGACTQVIHRFSGASDELASQVNTLFADTLKPLLVPHKRS